MLKGLAFLFALFSLLLAPPGAESKRVYKFQDEDGVWHFTDKRPATEQPVESRILDVEPAPRLQARDVGTQGSPRYVFSNGYHGPMQVAVEITESENLKSDPPLPATFVMQANEERQLFDLGPREPGRNWSFRFNFTYVPGAPGARHDGTLYRLPFPESRSFRVSQGFDGEHTHNEPGSRFAVDIVMPEGTPVLAARDGVVMDVERDFHKSGTDRDYYGARANHVRVLHSDGTMGVYAHLMLESVQVHPGQAVLAGDRLGYSGNTGFTTGPHLHFAVQRNAGMQVVSVPFRFRGPDGRPIEPAAGTTLGGR